ncbi:MAG: outer membrane protein assembly factor BamB family protein [Alphaproteobacteria bacterium]
MIATRIAMAICAAAILLSACQTVEDLLPERRSTTKLQGERVPLIALEEQLQADPQLAESVVTLPPPYKNPDWPQPGGYADNVMHHLEAAGPLHVAWVASAGKGSDDYSHLAGPPIVAEGRVYVLDAASRVTAFDANTGQVIWRTNVAPSGGESTLLSDASFGLLGRDTSITPDKGFGGGLAYDEGKLFVTSGFGFAKALDPKSGKEIWRSNLSVPITDAPVANGGRVFVITQENHLHALAQADGRVLWDHQGIIESAGILSGTSPAVAGEIVAAPYSSGELFAIRVENGRVAWNDTLTRTGTTTPLTAINDIAGRPVIDRGLVLAVSHSGRMVAIDTRTGERAWTNTIAGTQTPWVAGDYVYVVSIEGQLVCLTRKEGRIRWVTQLPRWEDPDDKSGPIYWSGPVLVSDRLLLLSSNGLAVSVSPYTGKILGQVGIPDGAFIAPVVANGMVYMLTNGAELVALK